MEEACRRIERNLRGRMGESAHQASALLMNSQSKQRPEEIRPDYSVVTEIPGIRVTDEAIRMLYSRYAYAVGFCEGKDVLEVGCGPGQGLGFLAKEARSVVGGDYTATLLEIARRHYGSRVPLVRLDAHFLPFRNASFDVVLLFEAIYYLSDPVAFVRECRRVLRPEGILLVCSVNKEWAEFNPSLFSHKYFSAEELRALLLENGFDAELFVAFPATATTLFHKAVRTIRVLAIRLQLIPSTMRGKELLKRLFYGRLLAVGPELEHQSVICEPLVSIKESDTSRFKILYSAARVRNPVRSVI